LKEFKSRLTGVELSSFFKKLQSTKIDYLQIQLQVFFRITYSLPAKGSNWLESRAAGKFRPAEFAPVVVAEGRQPLRGWRVSPRFLTYCRWNEIKTAQPDPLA